MLVVQLLIALSSLIFLVASNDVMEEKIGDFDFMKLSGLFPTEQSPHWIVPQNQTTHLRQHISTEGFLPGYLFYSNFGTDNSCAHTSFLEGHVRRLNDCFYGLIYKVGITKDLNYQLDILHFADNSCKKAKPSATQTFYFPKNTCVNGMQFFTSVSPSSLADDMYGIGFAYYRKEEDCIANPDWKTSSMIDLYYFGTCFAADGVDVFYKECTSDNAEVQLYGSMTGQCAGDFNTKTFNFDPVCQSTDLYGRSRPGFYRGFCIQNA